MPGAVEFEHGANSVAAPSPSRSVNVAVLIQDHAGGRIRAVRLRCRAKGIQHREIPGRIHLVHHPAAGRAITGITLLAGEAAVGGGPIEIASRIERRSRQGLRSVRAAGKSVNHRLMARPVHFVQDALVRRAAKLGSTVKITGAIQHDAGLRVPPVRSIDEVVQYGFLTVRPELVNDPLSGCTSGCGSAVQVSAGVASQARHGTAPRLPSRKAVEHRLVARRIHLEHHPCVECATGEGGSVQIACRIDDHPRVRG